MKSRASVAVIGGGIAGLTCAYELQRLGINTHVYEKNTGVGGRMLTQQVGKLFADLGANFFAPDTKEVVRYCRALNIPYKRLPSNPAHVLYHGTIVPAGGFSKKSLLRSLLRSDVRWGNVLRILWRVLGGSRTLYDLSLTDERFDNVSAQAAAQMMSPDMATYALGAPLSGLAFYGPEQLSQTFYLNAVRQVLRYPSGTQYSAGPMHDLPHAIARSLDIRYEEIERVNASTGGVTLSTHSGTYHYSTVVIACPPELVELPHATTRQQELLRSIQYSSTVTAAIRVPHKLINWFSLIFIPRVEHERISVITNEGRKKMEDTTSLMGIGLHHAAATTLMNRSDDELARLMIEDVNDILPATKEYTEQMHPVAIQRWRHAIPIYSPELIGTVRKFWTQGQGENNVYFCGDYMNHPFVEGSILSGQKVSRLIQKRRA